MLVVSDTSPIRALSVIGHVALLHLLYGKVVVPPGVVSELAVPVPRLPAVAITDHPFLEVLTPANTRLVSELRQSLGTGEAEAIALALQLRSPAILIDDHRARVAAARLGLRPVGVLAVLTEAKQGGHIALVAPLVEEMKNRIAFRVHPALLSRVLRAVGEAESFDRP